MEKANPRPTPAKGSVFEGSEQENWVAFGEWIQQQRLAAVLTQEQAASRAGWNYRQWSRYERGGKARKVTVIKIAEALNLNPQEALMRAGFVQESERREISHSRDLTADAVLRISEDARAAGKLEAIRCIMDETANHNRPMNYHEALKAIRAILGPRRPDRPGEKPAL